MDTTHPLSDEAQHYLSFISEVLRDAGALTRKSFGPLLASETKEDPTQIVTALDRASENLIISRIQEKFPNHSIIAEESGFLFKERDFTWIIDPIDGTSNYANGLPWYGVMVALLQNDEPLAAGIYLPITDELYTAYIGEGAYKNGRKLVLPNGKSLNKSLVSFCMSSNAKLALFEKESAIIEKLIPRILNLRTTNSALDYAYAAEGKLQALINHDNKIWDIAPVYLIAKEVGNIVTDASANDISLTVDEATYTKNFTLVISHPTIAEELLALISS